MSQEKNYLVLAQFRKNSDYNDFLGKYYHFPKKYFTLFKPNTEFIYFEPDSHGKGKGVYFGFGKIKNEPFQDNRESGQFFVEIENYKPFSKEVPFVDSSGKNREGPPFYNAQNSVRRIEKNILEEICLDGGILLNFKADSHLIKVLGEQLIASEKVGILELIKNSYDAHASQCNIRIEKVPNLQQISNENYNFNQFDGPVIVIEDNGLGMTKEIIENGWLRPASTIKTNVKEKLKQERIRAIEKGSLGSYNSLIEQLKKQHKGRIPLGEKGVGRFATHRLGKNLIIKTKTKASKFELVLKINWDDFDKVSDEGIDLDSIGISLTRQLPSIDYGKIDSGTQIIIYGGRKGFELSEDKIQDINKSILRLNSPNPNPGKIKPAFEVTLECPQIDSLPKKSIYEEFEPNFKFDVLVNENGIAEDYNITFYPPRSIPLPKDVFNGKNYDLKTAEKDYWKSEPVGIRSPKCGAFYLHLDVWYRKKPWIEGPDYSNMISYLDEYGGISIYRDNLLIFPAESGTKNDWLGLTTRHIKQGFRVSYYNFIGNLELEQTENLGIEDKSNREGMLENQAFLDLSKLVKAAIQNIFEIYYIDIRDKVTDLTKDIIRDPKELGNVTEQSARIISDIYHNYDIEKDPSNILATLQEFDNRGAQLTNLERSLKQLHKSIELIEESQELLTEQAGFGLGVAVSIHEIAKITANFYSSVSKMIKAGKIDLLKLEDLRESSLSLRTELKRLNPLRAIRSEPRIEFNILKSIEFVIEVYKNQLRKEKIDVEVIGKGFDIYARYGALNQIFSNLFSNSIYWLDVNSNKSKKIKILLEPEDRIITFADNGTGIDDIIVPHLFKVGFSLKIPPSGLGLYICKYYMQSMKGDIYLTHDKDRIKDLSGAQFTLDCSRTPSNKEEA